MVIEWISKLLEHLAKEKITEGLHKLEVFGVVINWMLKIIPYCLDHSIAVIIIVVIVLIIAYIIIDFVKTYRLFL